MASKGLKFSTNSGASFGGKYGNGAFGFGYDVRSSFRQYADHLDRLLESPTEALSYRGQLTVAGLTIRATLSEDSFYLDFGLGTIVGRESGFSAFTGVRVGPRAVGLVVSGSTNIAPNLIGRMGVGGYAGAEIMLNSPYDPLEHYFFDLNTASSVRHAQANNNPLPVYRDYPIDLINGGPRVPPSSIGGQSDFNELYEYGAATATRFAQATDNPWTGYRDYPVDLITGGPKSPPIKSSDKITTTLDSGLDSPFGLSPYILFSAPPLLSPVASAAMPSSSSGGGGSRGSGSRNQNNAGNDGGRDAGPNKTRRSDGDATVLDVIKVSASEPDRSSSSKPVLLDISGDGISINPLSSSDQFFDFDGDGIVRRSAWANEGTGVLVLDADGDNRISNSSEFVFTEWDGAADSDLSAIRNVFDTNNNGKLDAGDNRWNEFKVSINGELRSLASLGIVSIDLTPTGSGQSFSDGSAITGMTSFTRADGSTGAVGDAVLAAESTGYLLQTTVEIQSDGTTTKEIRASNPNGGLAFINVVETSLDGHTILTKFDDDGNGTFDRSQTNVTSVAPDGIRTRTVTNFATSGALVNRTTTITSADPSTVTTRIDSNGDGLVDEEQMFVRNVDHSTSTTTRSFSMNGSVISSLTTVTAPGGLAKTTSLDLDGNGLADSIVDDTTVVSASGARTKTVTQKGRNGSIVAATVTATTADSKTQIISIDRDGDGVFDTIEVATRNVFSGDVTIQDSTFNNDGSLRGEKTSFVSSSGLVKTTATDVTGDGIADLSTSDITVVAANGTRTQTTQQSSADGSLLSRTVSVTNGNGTSREISSDSDGDGAFDGVRTIVSNASGVTETYSTYSPNGATLIARTVRTTSADGLTQSEALDIDGDGVTDAVNHSQTVKNADGAVIKTVTRFNGAGTVQLNRSVTTVSADGLDTLVEEFTDANQSVDASTRTIRSLDADGRILETVTSFAGTTQVSVSTTVTSADRTSIVQKNYLGSFGLPWKVTSTFVASDGTKTTTVDTFSPDGSTSVSRVTSRVSADGLETTITMDVNGDGKTDTRNIELTSLTADGGRIHKLTSYGGAYTGPANRIAETTITVAGNGLSSATASDVDGDGTIDRRSSEATVFNNNGSTTRTVSEFNGDGQTLVSREVLTTSATGLNVISELDVDGNGTVDLRTADVVDMLTNGGRTRTVTATNGSGVLRYKTVETISGDGLQKTSRVDFNGDGGYDSETSTIVAINGDQVTSQSTFSPDGTILLSREVLTKSANGLLVTKQSDLNGDGSFDVLERTERKTNPDGSSTVTISRFNGTGTVRTAKTITTTSSDGLVETVQVFINGDDLADVTTVTRKTLNSDGSVTQTVDQYAGSNNTKFGRTVSSISPDGRNTVGTLAWYANLLPVQQSSSSINADGSTKLAETTTRTANPYASKEVKTTSIAADGLSKSTKLEVYGYDGALAYSETISSTRVLNDDGSVVETQRDAIQTGGVIDQIVTTTAPNGLTQQKVWSGNHIAASLTKVTNNTDGSTTTSSTYGSAITNGALTGTTHELTTNKSANGLIENDIVTAGGKIAKTETRTFDVDGEKSTVTSFFSTVDGTVLRSETIIESADGMSISLERDTDGVSGVDYKETSIIGSDGRKTLTITLLNNDASVKERSTVVVSADALTKTSSFDTNGDGSNDRVIVDATTLNADGGNTLTHSEFSGSGTTLLNRKITVSSGDGLTRITQIQTTGSGATDETQYDIFTIDANGNEVQSSTVYYKDGSKRSAFTITKMRDGRTVTNFDYNGDGVIDQYQWDSISKSGNRQQTIGYPTGKSWRTGLGDA